MIDFAALPPYIRMKIHTRTTLTCKTQVIREERAFGLETSRSAVLCVRTKQHHSTHFASISSWAIRLAEE